MNLSTAKKIAENAITKFGSIDVVINSGIFFTKPFTDYTPDDFRRLSETNLEGYICITQLAVKQMLAQKAGGSVTCVTSAMVQRDGIRFNAVAPGEVDTPLHANDSREHMRSLSPMGEISEIQDIVDALVYLMGARHVTGEVLHVDAGARNGMVNTTDGSHGCAAGLPEERTPGEALAGAF